MSIFYRVYNYLVHALLGTYSGDLHKLIKDLAIKESIIQIENKKDKI